MNTNNINKEPKNTDNGDFTLLPSFPIDLLDIKFKDTAENYQKKLLTYIIITLSVSFVFFGLTIGVCVYFYVKSYTNPENDDIFPLVILFLTFITIAIGFLVMALKLVKLKKYLISANENSENIDLTSNMYIRIVVNKKIYFARPKNYCPQCKSESIMSLEKNKEGIILITCSYENSSTHSHAYAINEKMLISHIKTLKDGENTNA